MFLWPTPTGTSHFCFGFKIKYDEDVWINSFISASVSDKSVTAFVSGKY